MNTSSPRSVPILVSFLLALGAWLGCGSNVTVFEGPGSSSAGEAGTGGSTSGVGGAGNIGGVGNAGGAGLTGNTGGTGATGNTGGAGATGNTGGTGATGNTGGTTSSSGTGGSTSSSGTGGSTSSSGTGGSTSSSGTGGAGPLGGDTCATAADVTNGPFPYQLSGDFTDSPSLGVSCDSTITNAVWYTYSPPATGFYEIFAQNSTTSASWSRLAVMESPSCNPHGVELACVTDTSQTISTTVQLEQGTTYLIVFFTDGSAWPMTDPSITIAPDTVGPGETCALAYDVTGASFPVQLTGMFDMDPPAMSCDSSPTNAVWFSYQAPTTDYYSIQLTNTTATAWSRMAVFETTSCAPYGPELTCKSSTSQSIDATVLFTGGTHYLIAFFTDSSNYAMVNPSISIQTTTVAPGELCEEAYDVSGATFPVQLMGSFDYDPALGVSCDSSLSNAVWFRYTPTVSGSHLIHLTNNTTASSVWSRLAIFTTAACTPYGPEVDCVTNTDKTGTASVVLTQGVEYLILFATGFESDPMEDPEIQIF